MLIQIYSRKLWKIIFDCFVKHLLMMIIRLGSDYKDKELDDMLKKINKEASFLKDVFSQNVNAKEIEEGMKTIGMFTKALTDKSDDAVQQMFLLSGKLKELFNLDAYFKFVSRFRSDMSSKEKSKLAALIEEDRRKGRKESKIDGQLFICRFILRFINTWKFVKKLRAKVELKKKSQKEARAKKDIAEMYLKLSKNDILVCWLTNEGTRRTSAWHESLPAADEASCARQQGGLIGGERCREVVVLHAVLRANN